MIKIRKRTLLGYIGIGVLIIIFLDYQHISVNVMHIKKSMACKKIISAVNDFSVENTYYATIYFTEQDQDLIPLIKRTIDLYYPLLENDLNIKGQEKLQFVIYPDKYVLSDAVGINYSEGPPMGLYYGGIIHIISPDYWIHFESDTEKREAFLENGPIIHEMTHYLLDLKTGGNYEIWFTEGVALYYEYKYTAFEWRKDLEGAGKGVETAQMKAYFNQAEEAVAYRCAFEKVQEIIGKGGEAELMQIMDHLEKGLPFETVLKVYGY